MADIWKIRGTSGYVVWAYDEKGAQTLARTIMGPEVGGRWNSRGPELIWDRSGVEYWYKSVPKLVSIPTCGQIPVR